MSQTPDPSPQRSHVDSGLAGPGAGSLNRALEQDLEKLKVESLLARADMANELTRDMEEASRAPLAVGEMQGVLERLSGPAMPEFDKLEDLMASPEVKGLAIEKNLLADLLREGAEGQAVLKRGLVFLKHRRYDEAAEWWSLHRQGLDPNTSRLHLLLLIMESLTYLWAGNPGRAAAAKEQVRAHPLLRKGR